MLHLKHFCERIILLLSCISILNVDFVFCGCQRTNPEWFRSDENENHLSAPIVSSVPGKSLT